MASAWTAGWQALGAALPFVFRGRRKRTFAVAVALGVAAGVVGSVLFSWALRERPDGPPAYTYFLICFAAMAGAASICLLVFTRHDRTDGWWIAATHESTMKQVLAASGAGASGTVEAKDFHNAQRASDELLRFMPAAVLCSLAGAFAVLLLFVISVTEGLGFAAFAAAVYVVIDAAAAASSLLTLGRAHLIATEVEPPAVA